jgi:hypothetical protein
MRLRFPNPNRSLDANQSRVCFWGYYSAIEIIFYVETDALKRLCPEMNSVESGILQAFDTARQRIHEVADKVYEHRSKNSCAYVLVAEDF